MTCLQNSSHQNGRPLITNPQTKVNVWAPDSIFTIYGIYYFNQNYAVYIGYVLPHLLCGLDELLLLVYKQFIRTSLCPNQTLKNLDITDWQNFVKKQLPSGLGNSTQ